MISKYNSFTLDSVLENAINESFLYYSPNVRKALNRIKSNDIATDLLGSELTDVKPDMTFIDLGKEGYLSFITMKNAKPLIVNKYPIMDYVDQVQLTFPDDIYELDKLDNTLSTNVYKKSRNEVTLGRFVNKLFPSKYNSKQVEDFVNSFKASIEKANEHFDEVIGEDIAFWYNSDNYQEKSGTLGSSCMAQKSDIFGIYTQNQDVCKMLILKEDDKILGRALVWKLNSLNIKDEDDENDIFFMDRQYTIKDSDVEKFKNYAIKNGWAYKTYNNHHSYGTITINGVTRNVDMTVQVADKDYNKYPYMDTFKRYDPNTGILYNDCEKDDQYDGQYILEETNGNFEEINQNTVWSDYHEEQINDEEAVWSDVVNSYIYSDRAIEVERGDVRRRGYYPDDYDSIFYDEDNEEYFHHDNGIYSDIEGRTLFDDTAVLVVTEILDDGDVERPDSQYMYEGSSGITSIDASSTWYKSICYTHRYWEDYSYIIKNLVTEDYNEDYIPIKFAVETYKITEARDNSVDIGEIQYLTKVDSLGLGYNIDEKKSRTVDWFSYTEEIIEFTGILLERLNILIIRYNDVLNKTGQLQFNFKDLDEQEYKDKISKNIDLCQNRVEDLENGTWD